MSRFVVLLRKELTEAWRMSRFVIVGAIFLFFAILSPLAAKYLPDLLQRIGGNVQITFPVPTVADAVDQFLKNAQTEIFVAILLVMGAVATEKERGTAGLVLTKPVGRATFLAAKFAALTLLFLAGMAVAGVAMYGYTAYLFGALPVGGFIACCLLLLVALLVYAAVTFLGSTIARGPVGAAGIGLGYFALVAVLGALPGMGRFTPGGLFACARQSALGVAPTHLLAALASNLGAIAIALAVACLIFRRQELSG